METRIVTNVLINVGLTGVLAGGVGYACAGVDGAIAGAKIGGAAGVCSAMMPNLADVPLREVIHVVGKTVFIGGASYSLLDGTRTIDQLQQSSCAEPLENPACGAMAALTLFGCVTAIGLTVTAMLKLMRF